MEMWDNRRSRWMRRRRRKRRENVGNEKLKISLRLYDKRGKMIATEYIESSRSL